jgi:hypothetical protein
MRYLFLFTWFTTITPLIAAIPGFQMPLGQCYNDTSMSRITQAMDAIPANQRPKVVEIAFAPYLDSACDLPSGKGRFDNINTMIRKLRSLNIEARVTIHVGDLHETVRNNLMGTRTKAVWDSVIAPYWTDAGVQFHMSPSLEDEYTKGNFTDALDRLVTQLDYSAVKSLVDARRFFFRRSTIELDSSHVSTSTLTYRIFTNTGDSRKPAFAVSIYYEYHGASPRKGVQIYSNDGYLVYANADEHHKHHGDDLLNSHEQFTLETFKSRAASASVALLWRPSYNVFDVKDVSGERRYSRNGVRKDSSTGKFDDREQSVFMSNLK